MDPKACWADILRSLREAGELTNDRARLEAASEAAAAMRALADWLDKGGFAPDVG